MKVKELIARLGEFDENLPVVYYSPWDGCGDEDDVFIEFHSKDVEDIILYEDGRASMFGEPFLMEKSDRDKNPDLKYFEAVLI